MSRIDTAARSLGLAWWRQMQLNDDVPSPGVTIREAEK